MQSAPCKTGPKEDEPATQPGASAARPATVILTGLKPKRNDFPERFRSTIRTAGATISVADHLGGHLGGDTSRGTSGSRGGSRGEAPGGEGSRGRLPGTHTSRHTRCPARKVYGITYSARDGLLGGWSQQVYLKPGVKIIRLPDQVSPRQVMAGGCALPTSLHALDRAQIRLGDTVAVQGAGPVGLTCAALAKLSGAGLVLIIDSRENRLQMAREIGIDVTIPLDKDDPGEVVRQVEDHNRGRGADVTIEATGAPPAVPDGMRMTRDGGRYVIVGHYTDGGAVALNPHTDINRKHLEVRGCWGSDFSHFHRMVDVLTRFPLPSGRPWDHLVSATFGLHQMDEALASVRRGDVVKAIVDPWLGQS